LSYRRFCSSFFHLNNKEYHRDGLPRCQLRPFVASWEQCLRGRSPPLFLRMIPLRRLGLPWALDSSPHAGLGLSQTKNHGLFSRRPIQQAQTRLAPS